jgi:uncharacterized membrane protein YbhN (UPF0104 family)
LEKKINKLLFRDCAIIVSILGVLWCILCFVMVQISAIMPNHAARIGIMSAGIIAGTFATAASAAVFIHLSRNRKELYSQELLGKEITFSVKRRDVFLEITDSLFIMILCFGTLLTAMFMKGSDISLSYTIHIKTFLIVFLGLIVCLHFILKNSEKELKKMIEYLYQQ